MGIYVRKVFELWNKYGGLEREAINNRSKKIKLSKKERKQISESRAGEFLNGIQNMKHITFQYLFYKFIEMMQNNWTWDGTVNFDLETLGEVLDGDRSKGECALLAGALLALWRWPKPFGLEKKGGVLRRYGGAHGLGFYSLHPIAGVLNLKPDVRKPIENLREAIHEELFKSMLLEHYLKPSSVLPIKNWDNHKTVKINGMYYDPSYGRIYKNEKEMQLFEVIREGKNLFQYQEAKALHTIRLGSITVRAQQLVYFIWINVFGGRDCYGFGPYFSENEVYVPKPSQYIIVTPPSMKKTE